VADRNLSSIESDIELTRERLASTIDQLAYRTSPKTIAKREVNTAVLMEDGQTVVIGGVYEFRDRADVTKVPWLGDLPVIGNLFKKKGRTKEKAELLIFVTPKVMQVAQRG